MPNTVAVLLIAASIVITAAGHPAYGIIPLGVLIAANGQQWRKRG